jgi:ribonuclease P protein component
MRLPSRLRIKASSEFAKIKAKGASHPGRFLVLSVLEDAEVATFRFGLVTTRKLGGAVTRNAIRRRLREVVRTEQHRLKSGLLIVIIARWRAPEASVEDLRRDYLKLAARAGILNEKP